MANYNNLQQVEFAKRALAAGWKYWYGTVGYKATQSLLNSKARQYPAHYTAGRMGTYRRHIEEGRMVADCVGQIKSFFWSENGSYLGNLDPAALLQNWDQVGPLISGALAEGEAAFDRLNEAAFITITGTSVADFSALTSGLISVQNLAAETVQAPRRRTRSSASPGMSEAAC